MQLPNIKEETSLDVTYESYGNSATNGFSNVPPSLDILYNEVLI
jgi:hypothetical protein